MPKFFQNARDPISSYSHFLGAVLSLIGLAAMAIRLACGDSALQATISCLLFCLSLIALYSASGIYHFSCAPARVILILRKLDHAMIYVLIAGTYSPILLTQFPQPTNLYFTAAIWTAALCGIILKLCWINAPRWLGTSLYILMGWAILADLPAIAAMPLPAIALLAAGGICYTAGGLIYLFKRPNLSPSFGFHELFHILVIFGSLFHYFMVLFYVA